MKGTRQLQNVAYQGYGQVFSWFCNSHLIKSTSLGLIIDGTSDVSNTRRPITILLSGCDEKQKFWCVPMRFTEPVNHTADTQLAEIERLFLDINELLRDHADGLKRLFVFSSYQQSFFVYLSLIYCLLSILHTFHLLLSFYFALVVFEFLIETFISILSTSSDVNMENCHYWTLKFLFLTQKIPILVKRVALVVWLSYPPFLLNFINCVVTLTT